ncbi:MAG: ribosomal-processing cysteine protease Prp [Spirochaetales bacterium]|nr:ribosomal-processing cysteine protease Prp [Spirochaetales bacterium]
MAKSGSDNINLDIILDSQGCLKRMKAKGHAEGEPGKNIPCALVSSYLRTAARLLESRGFVVQGKAGAPGSYDLALPGHDRSQTLYLKGVTDYLLKALWDIRKDYPGNLNITIEDDDSGGR